MRISDLLPLLALAACGQPQQEQARYDEARAVEAAPKFFCAQGGGELRAECTAERTAMPGGGVAITMRHPDGHFRRFAVSPDARTVEAADGAEPVAVSRAARALEIAIGSDRYRLPLD